MYKAGLAYEAQICLLIGVPVDLTGLANEEVVNGRCERCGTPLNKRIFANGCLKLPIMLKNYLMALIHLTGQKK